MLTIVDAVTSLGGIQLEVDAWGIDAIYSGSQKCLSCTPGLSPISFSAKAEQVIKARNRKVQSWFMDMSLIMNYWEAQGGARTYHHTAPVNGLYGLHESLVMLKEEGLENSWARHKKNHLALRAGLEAMGLELLVAEHERLPQLNAIKVPAGCDEAAVRKRLLERLVAAEGFEAFLEKRYIGKKRFFSSRTKQVKGKKKKTKVESDWRSYYGSNAAIQEDVKNLGESNFRRDILYLCNSLSECSYLELKEQVMNQAILSPQYYNDWIQIKVTRKHLKRLQLSDVQPA